MSLLDDVIVKRARREEEERRREGCDMTATSLVSPTTALPQYNPPSSHDKLHGRQAPTERLIS